MEEDLNGLQRTNLKNTFSRYANHNVGLLNFCDTSAGTGKLCILGHLGLVFIWSCFVSCLLFLLFYVSLRNLCSGTCRKIQFLSLSREHDKTLVVNRNFLKDKLLIGF